MTPDLGLADAVTPATAAAAGGTVTDGVTRSVARDQWPDLDLHRELRRCIVRVFRTGFSSGSGILVGPDLILTCRHVLSKMLPLGDAASFRAAGSVTVTIGLEGPGGAGVITRNLRINADRPLPPGRSPWEASAADPAGQLDFVLLRLDEDVGDEASWLHFQEPQSPRRLKGNAGDARIEVFMYHFPDPADGTPYIEPRLSAAPLSGDWLDGSGLVKHVMASESGSSGAMLFASVNGSRPFPLAIHLGVTEGTAVRLALPMSDILKALMVDDPDLYRQLTTPPKDLRREQEVTRQAEPLVRLARNLIDRDKEAKSALGGTFARVKKVQPMFAKTITERTLFQARLEKFDLPLRRVDDPSKQQKMRRWTLAGGLGEPPIERGVAEWKADSLSSDTWLDHGPKEAVETVLYRLADAQALGSPLLMTARVRIGRPADYRALEELLLALSQALRGPQAVADALLLLWIDDDRLSDAVRSRERRALRRLWDGPALSPIVGSPLELPDVEQQDLTYWATDVAAAYDVKQREVDFAVSRAWQDSGDTAAATAEDRQLAFDKVVQALDEPLQSWVCRHFRRVFEAGGGES
jgi:hypothetical protein